MSPIAVGLTGIVFLVLLFLLKMPVAFAMALVGFFGFAYLTTPVAALSLLANDMFDKLFRANDWGVGSASAMIIMLLVTPILVWNVMNARKEMR